MTRTTGETSETPAAKPSRGRESAVAMKSTTAFHLNNQATSLIRSRCYDGAVNLLVDVVRCYRSGQILPSSVFQSPAYSMHRKRPELKTEQQPLHLLPGLDASSQTLLSTNVDSQDPFIYEMPILLDDSQNNPQCVCLSVVFNFAIAKHLRALQTIGNPTKREERLWSALKLYNWVLAIERTMDEFDSPLGPLPCLGLINNCAQIHKELNKSARANKMFQVLLNSLMLVKEREEEITAQELDGFIQSISHLILKGPTVAEAA